MQKKHKLLVLAGVLAVLCIATLLVKHTEQKKEQIKNTDAVILTVDPDSVTSLSWEYDTTSLAYEKQEGTWQWTEDAAFPVDPDVIRGLLENFESFGAAFIIEDVEDLKQYGLTDPTCTIRFATAEQSYEVLLGAYSNMDSQRYVSIGDGNVYLVKTDPMDSFSLALADTVKNDTIPDFDTIESMHFTGAAEYALQRIEDSSDTYCSSDRYFIQKDGRSYPLDTYRVEDYGSALHLLGLADMSYASYNVTEEELAAWGLDRPELTVVLNYSSKDADDSDITGSFSVSIGLNQEELAAKRQTEAEGKEYSGNVSAYLRVNDSQIVYQLSDSDYKTLSAAGINDLRHNEVLTADFDSITSMDITLEGNTYTITAQAPEDKDDDTIYLYNDEEITITTLKNKLTALSVNDFESEAEKGREEISLVFHLDSENFPEVKVQLFRCDGTNCLAVLDGETLGLVSRSSVVNLVEAVNAIVLG